MPSPNPFSKLAENAKESAHTDDATLKQSSINSRKCAQCGAPRPVDTDISHCSYCGFEFMVVSVQVNRPTDHE